MRGKQTTFGFLYLVSSHVGVLPQVQLHVGSELGLILATESRESDALNLNVNSLG